MSLTSIERAGMAEVLEVLAQRLEPEDTLALSAALPAELARHLRDGRHVGEFDLAELTLRVAGRAQVTRAMAAAHVERTCRAIAELIEPKALQRLLAFLPAPMARLFVAGERADGRTEYHLSRRHSTLAEGRPGSAHPLSESHPERAQADSIVRSDNPHGDSKLSSAPGLLQEREHESLATGRPGSEHPLSERR